MSDFDDFETSLAELNLQEEIGTIAALHAIDDALYFSHTTPVEPFEVPEVDAEVDVPPSDPYEVYRCMGDGYDAHELGVDEKELALWRSAFPYLAVRGIGYFEDDGNDGIEEFETSPIDPLPETRLEEIVLKITGRACVIHSPHPEHSEEIIEMDGILEEVFAIDDSGDDGAPSTDEDTVTFMNPETCAREEVIDILYEHLLPDIAESFRPLIEKVVRIGEERGHPLDNEEKDEDGDEVRNYDSWSDC